MTGTLGIEARDATSYPVLRSRTLARAFPQEKSCGLFLAERNLCSRRRISTWPASTTARRLEKR